MTVATVMSPGQPAKSKNHKAKTRKKVNMEGAEVVVAFLVCVCEHAGGRYTQEEKVL